MDWYIDKSPLPKYLRLVITGKPSVEEYLELWRNVLAIDDWKQGTPILQDVTGREPLGSEAHRIQTAIADLLTEHRDRIGSSNIAVFTNPDVYNYGRILEYALRLRGSQMLIRTFENEDEAVEWLNYVS
jgi:hypothetical protein